MKTARKISVVLVAVFAVVWESSYAQPSIPPDIPTEVREQIERLYSQDVREQLNAIRTLGDMHEKAAPAIPFLLGLFSGEHRFMHKGADVIVARALSRIGAPAVEPLIAALEKENSVVRSVAIDALVGIRDERVMEPIIGALNDEDGNVRRRAARALGEIKDTRATLPLIAALTHEDPGMRSASARALGEVRDNRAVETLISTLKDGAARVRSSAASALGMIGSTPAVEPLVAALEDESKYVRLSAASALAALEDSRAVEPLIAALNDEEVDVRRRAACALVRTDDDRAVDSLIAALEDKHYVVRQTVARVLGGLKDVRAVEPLIGALEDEHYVVRQTVARVLGELKDVHAVEPLIAALKDESRRVRHSAFWALGEIGDGRAAKPLVAALKREHGDDQREAAVALMKIGRPAVEPLMPALKDSDLSVRWYAAFILRRTTEHDFGVDREEGVNVVSECLFYVVPLAFSLFFTILIWGVFRPFRRKRGRGRSRAERVLAFCCLLCVVALIMSAIFLAKGGRYAGLLYRNPIVFLPFRFALSYLVGVPIVFALRTVRTDRELSLKLRALRAALATLTFAVLAALSLLCLVGHGIFGYLPSVTHNPFQVLLPFVAAMSVHIFWWRKPVRELSRKRRMTYAGGLILSSLVLLAAATLPTVLLAPARFDWLAEYLSVKYGVDKHTVRKLATLPQPLSVVKEQPAPPGLIVRYLVFGETAVDYSVMD